MIHCHTYVSRYYSISLEILDAYCNLVTWTFPGDKIHTDHYSVNMYIRTTPNKVMTIHHNSKWWKISINTNTLRDINFNKFLLKHPNPIYKRTMHSQPEGKVGADNNKMLDVIAQRLMTKHGQVKIWCYTITTATLLWIIYVIWYSL